jgi:protein-disulfide isomerase
VHAQSVQQQNREILSELKQIRQLLEKLTTSLDNATPKTPTPVVAPPAKVTLSGLAGYAIGNADAPLTMVEFTDLQCPFCRQFHLATFEQIKRNYIDTGKVRYISRDFPLEAIHQHALVAARAARCAGDQGRFWEMRHQVMLNNPQLSPAMIGTLAQDLQLDTTSFRSCVEGSRFDAEIKKDVADATAIGVSGTPSFIVGRTPAANGPEKIDRLEGALLVGAQPYAVFESRLNELLAAPR